MENERKFTKYKVPGGKRIRLVDEEAVLAFNSYYPEWNKQFYIVPPYLSERNSLFGTDKGYEGEAKIAIAFEQSGVVGILVSNFSNKDQNKILQSKSKVNFECDFVLLTEEYGMFIIEVCHSVVGRIQKSIREKFEQLTKRSRKCIIELGNELFGRDFSMALGSICNGIIAIPDANKKDFASFKESQSWKDFVSSSPGYKIMFVGKDQISQPFLIAKTIKSRNMMASFVDSLLSFTREFYAAITLVKTSFESFNLEDILSKAEKKEIEKVTYGMRLHHYHIILSPEQWSILKDLPSYLLIVGEAATGKTELLKALLYMIMRYDSPTTWKKYHSSRLLNIRKGIKKVLFIILGNKPYLQESIKVFTDCLDKQSKVTAEVHMIPLNSVEEIDENLLTILCAQGNLRNVFVLIDECYHSISEEVMVKLSSCKGCWIATVLTGQDAFEPVRLNRKVFWFSFSRRILRCLFRGTQGITVASSTLQLCSTVGKIPAFLGNQFSYIKSFSDIKVENINRFFDVLYKSGQFRSSFNIVIKGKRFIWKYVDYFHEEFSLQNVNFMRQIAYQTSCSGFEWTSVTVILALSFEEFDSNNDVVYQLLSIYTSRAINDFTILCSQSIAKELHKRLIRSEVMQIVRSGNRSDLSMLQIQDIFHDFKCINVKLNPIGRSENKVMV